MDDDWLLYSGWMDDSYFKDHNTLQYWENPTDSPTDIKITQMPTKKSTYDLPSGKRLHNYGPNHHFSWENPL